MKHIFLRISSCLLALALLLSLLCVTALAAPAASFSGSSGIQAGNSVTLTLSVDSKIYGLSGTLNYGKGLSFTNYSCSASGWGMEVNGTKFSAYGTSPTSGAILTVTLKVDGSTAAGTALSASFSDIVVSDGERDTSLSTANWSGSVAAAPSGDNTLSTLSCGNATLSPAFSKNTTNYSCTVPYSVNTLDLKYSKSEGNAKVAVSGNSLEVGENTVTITVTAANGSAKYYTISVTREQDPNYKASTNANLSELTIEGTSLSPTFRPTVLEYVAFVPFETQEVTLHGVPADEKAMGTSDKTVKLLTEGDNLTSLVCTAEDGKTTQTYQVHIYRMPAYLGGNLLVEVTDPDAEPEEPPIPTAEVPLVVTLPLIGEASTLLVGGIALGIVVILLFLLGFLIGRIGRGGDDEDEEYEEEREDRPRKALEEAEVKSLPGEPIYEIRPRESENARALPARETKTRKKEEQKQEGKEVLGAEELSEAEKAADRAAAEMSLEELLNDIHNL